MPNDVRLTTAATLTARSEGRAFQARWSCFSHQRDHNAAALKQPVGAECKGLTLMETPDERIPRQNY